MEKYLDEQGLTDPHVPGFAVDPESLKPVRLSLDLKATHALRDELSERHGALEGQGRRRRGHGRQHRRGASRSNRCPITIPTRPIDAQDTDKINRINVGVYEMGSTFKALTIAMALDSGKVNLGSRIDARDSLRYGRFTIHDFHATHRILTVPEVFTHLLQHRHRAHGADGRRRGPPGVPAEDGPARPPAHRTARERRAAGAEALERAQHHDHRLRPGPQRRAAAGDDGACRRWSTAAT